MDWNALQEISDQLPKGGLISTSRWDALVDEISALDEDTRRLAAEMIGPYMPVEDGLSNEKSREFVRDELGRFASSGGSGMSELNDPDIPFVDTTVVSASAGAAARDITPLITKTDDLSGGVNETRYVEYEEGGETKRACFKPADGENPRVLPMFAGKQTSNEVAAGIIDEELGLGLGGKVEMAVVEGQKGALLEWINDTAESGYEATLFKVDLEADPDAPIDYTVVTDAKGFSNMLHYDMLIGNADRHLGNFLIKDGEVKIIDNGMAFGKNEEYENPKIRLRTVEVPELAQAARNVPPSPEFKAGLSKILADRERVDKRMADAGMAKENRDAFWKRAEYLQKIKGNWGMFNESSLKELAVMAEGRTPW